jgi:hypothetical protein
VSEYVVRNGRRIEVEILAPKTAVQPKRSHQGLFVRVPLAWVERLRAARCIGSYRLAHHLLFQHWKSNGATIKLSNTILAKLGIRSLKMKGQALLELERFGLISVERLPKKSPIVTIIDV